MNTPDLTKPTPIINKPDIGPKFEAPLRGGSIPMKGPYVDPKKLDPIKGEPVKVEPFKKDTAKAEPVKPEPSTVEPPAYPQRVDEPKTGHVTETAKK